MKNFRKLDQDTQVKLLSWTGTILSNYNRELSEICYENILNEVGITVAREIFCENRLPRSVDVEYFPRSSNPGHRSGEDNYGKMLEVGLAGVAGSSTLSKRNITEGINYIKQKDPVRGYEAMCLKRFGVLYKDLKDIDQRLKLRQEADIWVGLELILSGFPEYQTRSQYK